MKWVAAVLCLLACLCGGCKKKAGDACGKEDPCGGDLACFKGACAEPRKSGESCEVAEQCEPGLECSMYWCMTPQGAKDTAAKIKAALEKCSQCEESNEDMEDARQHVLDLVSSGGDPEGIKDWQSKMKEYMAERSTCLEDWEKESIGIVRPLMNDVNPRYWLSGQDLDKAARAELQSGVHEYCPDLMLVTDGLLK